MRVSRLAGIAAGLLAVALLAGCAQLPVSGVYVGSARHDVYAKLPPGWVPLDGDAFLAAQMNTPAATVPPESFVAPFAMPPSGLADVLTSADTPVGVLEYRALERVAVRAELVNAAFGNLSDLVAEGSVRLVQEPDLLLGQDSVAMSFDVPTVDGTARYLQRAVLDPDGRGFRMVVVGCSLRCFDAHGEQIRAVVSSFPG